jgi:hypothetical protein
MKKKKSIIERILNWFDSPNNDYIYWKVEHDYNHNPK